jgi:hypothetical protein
MQKSDGNDPDAATDGQRSVTSDVPPADVGSTQRDLFGRFVTGGGARKGAGGGAGTDKRVADEISLTADEEQRSFTSDVPPADVGSTQRDLLGRFVTGGGAGKGAGGGAGTDRRVADVVSLTADEEHSDREQPEVDSEGEAGDLRAGDPVDGTRQPTAGYRRSQRDADPAPVGGASELPQDGHGPRRGARYD